MSTSEISFWVTHFIQSKKICVCVSRHNCTLNVLQLLIALVVTSSVLFIIVTIAYVGIM